ncbi:transporter, putative [Plasmodium gallinaceum]|uniref:Transporter, putative n=1 Tax=Plasmodium gallinaceum TaxID=5849 RepID=A0A1J1GU10_PLAGA|nr:transporter, putative [Plasmodium gallinaceum]CRG95970.1 transporter, putative [Plasmodium gallinaceum]
MNLISNTNSELNKCYIKLKEEEGFKTKTKFNVLIFCYVCFFVYTWYISIICLYPIKFNDLYFIFHFLFQGIGAVILGLFSDIYGRKKCLNISFSILFIIFLITFITVKPSFFLFYENSKTLFRSENFFNLNIYPDTNTENYRNTYKYINNYNESIQKLEDDKDVIHKENSHKIFRKNNTNQLENFIFNNNDKLRKKNANKKVISNSYIKIDENESEKINVIDKIHYKKDDLSLDTNDNFVIEDDKNNNKDINNDHNKNNTYIYDINNDKSIYVPSSNYDNLNKYLEDYIFNEKYINHKNNNYNGKKKTDNPYNKLNNNLYKNIKKNKIRDNFKELNRDLTKIIIRSLNKRSTQNFRNKFFKNLIKECIKEHSNKSFIRLQDDIIGENKMFNIIKKKLNETSNNTSKINQNLTDIINDDVTNIINICVNEILSIANKMNKFNYNNEEEKNLFIKNKKINDDKKNEKNNEEKNGINFKSGFKNTKNEDFFLLISRIIFYILTCLSGFFIKGVNNILCIIITENIKPNYKTRAVCLIFIIENFSLIMIRLIFFFNEGKNLYFSFKLNLLLLAVLNIIIIYILNIYFSNFNTNFIKMQIKTLKKMCQNHNQALLSSFNNDNENIMHKENLNNEKNSKKINKNNICNLKNKNYYSNNNFTERLLNTPNIYRLNNDDSKNILIDKFDENYNFDNLKSDVILSNLMKEENYSTDKISRNNYLNSLSESIKINDKKKKDDMHDINKIFIDMNYNNISDKNNFKKRDDHLLSDKINVNKNILEYTKNLKKNETFKIYMKWISYYFDIHKYLIVALCLLFFLFNFLYISFFIIYNLFIYDIKNISNFYKLNNSFIIVNLVILIFYFYLYFKLNRIILKILNLFGYLLITFVSFGLILFLFSTSYFHFSLCDNTYIIYIVIFYSFLFIPNVSLFLFSINSFHTICKGVLIGIFVFFGNLGFITYSLIKFFITLKYFTFVNLIFSCLICILSSIIMILFIPQINTSIDHNLMDKIYFNHFLTYIYNKKKVSPLFRTISISYEVHNN